MNTGSLYFSTISKSEHLVAKKDLKSNLERKTLAYTYVNPEVCQKVFDQYKNASYEEGIPSFFTRKISTVFAVLDSFLELITDVFLAIIEPTSINWYSAGKDGEIFIGQMIRLFDDPRGLYWIDLARFDKDCYQRQLILSHPVHIVKKQLLELKPNKNVNQPKNKQITNQLKASLNELKLTPKTPETETLKQRIQRRITYTATSNIEQKNAQMELIQKEPDDEIKRHFCNLFQISTEVK